MRFANHILLMLLYAICTSAFFALLWREEPRSRVRMFALLFLGLLAGGILMAVLMSSTFNS